METTTFMVTKAKKGIYQLYLVWTLFRIWNDEDWDVASLVPKIQTHLLLEVR